MSSSTFKIRLADPSDILELCDVYFDAWSDSIILQRLFPAHSNQSKDFWLNGLKEDFCQRHAVMLVVMDTSTSPETIVSFAKWVGPLDLNEEYPEVPNISVWPKDGDPEAADELFNFLHQKHHEIMENRPHWYLEMIATRKLYQGKGSGKILMEWGIKRADQDEIECYLESTSEGKSLYQKFDFITIYEEWFFNGLLKEEFMMRKSGKKEKTKN